MLLHDPDFDEVREAQVVFRKVLDAMAWPGKVIALPRATVRPPQPWPASVVQVARTLLDNKVTFAVHGENSEALSRYLTVNTGSAQAPANEAGFVFAQPTIDGLAIWNLNAGTLLSPDDSATLVLACRTLSDPEHSPALRAAGPDESTDRDSVPVAICLRGRGIRGQRTIVVDQRACRVLQELAAMEHEYPLGIDVILADEAGHVAGLPRTTRWQKEGTLWAM